MPTWSIVCRIMGALPEAVLDPPDRDNPAWRVRGKVVVRLNPSMRVPDEDERRRERGELIAIWVDRAEREALVQEAPETFFLTPHWAAYPGVLVWVESVEEEQLRELLIDAWRDRAPKRVVRDWEGAHDRASERGEHGKREPPEAR
jgi:hypothetical protein